MAHIWEIKISQYIVKEELKEMNNVPGDIHQQQIKVFIKPLSQNQAFNKGVEYFGEIFFFYGILLVFVQKIKGKVRS